MGVEPEGGSPVAAVAGRSSGAAEEVYVSAVSRLTRILGTIVGSTSVVASLLYFFGWSHAYWFFNYFGVHSTLLDLTTSDYLMRSFDGLFVPVVVVACAGLLLLWGHVILRDRLAACSRPGVVRAVTTVTGIAGLVLALGGLLRVFGVRTVLDQYVTAAPLSIVTGVLLVAYTGHLRRSSATGPGGRERRAEAGPGAVAQWAAVLVLVALSLFWAANDYSAAVGRSRARQFAAKLPTYPGVIVYSDRSLSLDAPGVREVRCHDAKAAYRFRYSGLTLMIQSGGQYLFLPRSWSPARGTALLMPRDGSLRLEFLPVSARDVPLRSTC
ncbi:hypothetical protein GCM10022226_74310 [Sphaerisporangium flaviroseum]|uniref:DUF5671 domain-containing protein n=1 Tax=Sphaerisporangium flaviroseum TaxID=509199 RepID=A0ABP7JD22_9ACTN